MRGGDTSTILGNLLGQESNLAADFGELPEDLVAQYIEASAKTRDGLYHQIESRAQLFDEIVARPSTSLRSTKPQKRLS